MGRETVRGAVTCWTQGRRAPSSLGQPRGGQAPALSQGSPLGLLVCLPKGGPSLEGCGACLGVAGLCPCPVLRFPWPGPSMGAATPALAGMVLSVSWRAVGWRRCRSAWGQGGGGSWEGPGAEGSVVLVLGTVFEDAGELHVVEVALLVDGRLAVHLVHLLVCEAVPHGGEQLPQVVLVYEA